MRDKIKKIIKQFLPPIIFNLYKSIFSKAHRSYSGFYKSFLECRQKNIIAAGYNNPNYAKWSRDKTERYLKLPDYKRTTCYIQEIKFLIYAQVLLDRLGNIRIFDFGGGVGWQYIKLFRLKEFFKIYYTIYELPEVVYISKDYFHNKGFKNIEFTDKMPGKDIKFDMCVLSSVLHYVEDYKGLLKDICLYNPKFIFISRLPAGDLQEFVTLQTINEASFPCYVFNWENIKKILSDLNYSIFDEWEEAESFYLNSGGKKITLPVYKGALFVSH